MTPAAPTPEKKENLAWVDALRGIAILGVMMVHCTNGGMSSWGRLVAIGQYGVQLFFVASAFTLARSWHRRQTEARPVANYLIRRLLRIAPLYLFGIALYTVLVLGWFTGGIADGTMMHDYGYTPSHIAANMLFVHGWIPAALNAVVPGGWSIGVEMSFYLLVPWLAAHLHRPKMALLAFVAAIPLAGLCAWGAYQASLHATGGLAWPVENNSFLYFWLPSQMPVFLLGFLAYGLLANPTGISRWKNKKHASCCLLGVSLMLLAMAAFCILGPNHWMPSLLRIHYGWLSPTLAGLCACSLLLALALHPWKLLVNPATLFLGKLSYSLYIVHFIGAWVLARWIHHHVPWQQTTQWGVLATFAAGIVACLAFSIPAAMLTHRLIEKPGMALGRWLIARLERAPNQ